MKKNEGFTLAEVLVTLAVIGVVAALAIPALLQNTNDAQYKTAWKKVYAEISGATKLLLKDNASSLKGVFTSDAVIRDKYKDYMNFIAVCDGTNTVGNCWHKGDEWYFFNGLPANYGNYPGAVLSNGMLLRFMGYKLNCNGTFNECARMTIDVNGFKGPDRMGKDIFYLYVLETGILPYGAGDGLLCDSDGQGCSATYLYGD